MAETLQILFALGFIVFLVYLVSRILLKPLKLALKIVVNSLFGLLLLWGFNFIGAFFDILIPINVVTILITGFLGIPGLIFLIIMQFLL
ncbi:MAG TPA: pro-sigmaK processing inhibitor BofA [Clostridia bacterium]|nr:pro-sigmaK processing inhibitor BofA [Clostridia bacterium]